MYQNFIKDLPHFRLLAKPALNKEPEPRYIEYGKQAFIYRSGTAVKEHFGRAKAILKIFHGNPVTNDMKLEDALWGDNPKDNNPKKNTTLLDATRFQNICWYHGLAPRVYGLFTTKYQGKLVVGQLVEDAGREHGTQEEAEEVYNKVVALAQDWGFKNEYEDVSKYDSIGGKLVDLQTFQRTKEYDRIIKDFYNENAMWGANPYQKVEGVTMQGVRKTWTRKEDMQLGSIDFKGKSVIDIGCSGGEMVRYALKHGARRVTGYDNNEFGNVTKAAFLMSNHLAYFNADFVKRDLNSEKPDGHYDIAFYLSMLLHTGYPDWLKEIAKFTILEWNCWFRDKGIDKPEDVKKTEEIISKDFIILRVGEARDHGNKPIYHCIPKI